MHSYIPVNNIILVTWIIEGPENRGSTVLSLEALRASALTALWTLQPRTFGYIVAVVFRNFSLYTERPLTGPFVRGHRHQHSLQELHLFSNQQQVDPVSARLILLERNDNVHRKWSPRQVLGNRAIPVHVFKPL